MKVIWAASAWSDYLRWQDEDQKQARKINRLIEDIRRSPFEGLGKPEPLKENWSGFWSRRIDGEHRLVYRIAGAGAGGEQRVEIAQCRYHY
ncbi:MAG: Txe/YoeB family addiction module toxin [Pseudomonadota bacterium]